MCVVVGADAECDRLFRTERLLEELVLVLVTGVEDLALRVFVRAIRVTELRVPAKRSRNLLILGLRRKTL